MIWCGKQVLRRPVLPVDPFRDLNNHVPNIKIQLVDRALKQMLSAALDAVSLSKKNILGTTPTNN